MDILIPMAGRGQRFRDAGFTTPKPLILVNGMPMLELVIANLGKPAPPEQRVRHILLVLGEHLDANRNYFQDVLPARLTLAGFERPVVIPVPMLTSGQASTCLLAAAYMGSKPLLIANCDQLVGWVPYDFVSRAAADDLDGIIVTFTSTVEHHSYVRLAPSGLVEATAEKQVISNLATCGLYFWRQGRDFLTCAYEMINDGNKVNGEYYVCPTFNYLMGHGGRVGIQHVAEHWPLGTPTELEDYLARTR